MELNLFFHAYRFTVSWFLLMTQRQKPTLVLWLHNQHATNVPQYHILDFTVQGLKAVAALASFHTCLNTSLKDTKSTTQNVAKSAPLYICKSSYQHATIVVPCPTKVAIRKHRRVNRNKYSCMLMYGNLNCTVHIPCVYVYGAITQARRLEECLNSCLHGYFIYLNYHISASKE